MIYGSFTVLVSKCQRPQIHQQVLMTQMVNSTIRKWIVHFSRYRVNYFFIWWDPNLQIFLLHKCCLLKCLNFSMPYSNKNYSFKNCLKTELLLNFWTNIFDTHTLLSFSSACCDDSVTELHSAIRKSLSYFMKQILWK